MSSPLTTLFLHCPNQQLKYNTHNWKIKTPMATTCRILRDKNSYPYAGLKILSMFTAILKQGVHLVWGAKSATKFRFGATNGSLYFEVSGLAIFQLRSLVFRCVDFWFGGIACRQWEERYEESEIEGKIRVWGV